MDTISVGERSFMHSQVSRSTARSRSTMMDACSLTSSLHIDIKSEIDEYEAILKYKILKDHEDEQTKQEKQKFAKEKLQDELRL